MSVKISGNDTGKTLEYIENTWNSFKEQQPIHMTFLEEELAALYNPIHKNLDDYKIFKYFSFPLMQLTKLKMKNISNDLGWQEIMNMTWFCHYPTKSERPCGICKPCIIALDESFGWRIPRDRRIISFYYRILFWPAKLGLRSQLINIGLYKDKKKDPLN